MFLKAVSLVDQTRGEVRIPAVQGELGHPVNLSLAWRGVRSPLEGLSTGTGRNA